MANWRKRGAFGVGLESFVAGSQAQRELAIRENVAQAGIRSTSQSMRLRTQEGERANRLFNEVTLPVAQEGLEAGRQQRETESRTIEANQQMYGYMKAEMESTLGISLPEGSDEGLPLLLKYWPQVLKMKQELEYSRGSAAGSGEAPTQAVPQQPAGQPAATTAPQGQTPQDAAPQPTAQQGQPKDSIRPDDTLYGIMSRTIDGQKSVIPMYGDVSPAIMKKYTDEGYVFSMSEIFSPPPGSDLEPVRLNTDKPISPEVIADYESKGYTYKGPPSWRQGGEVGPTDTWRPNSRATAVRISGADETETPVTEQLTPEFYASVEAAGDKIEVRKVFDVPVSHISGSMTTAGGPTTGAILTPELIAEMEGKGYIYNGPAAWKNPGTPLPPPAQAPTTAPAEPAATTQPQPATTPQPSEGIESEAFYRGRAARETARGEAGRAGDVEATKDIEARQERQVAETLESGDFAPKFAEAKIKLTELEPKKVQAAIDQMLAESIGTAGGGVAAVREARLRALAEKFGFDPDRASLAVWAGEVTKSYSSQLTQTMSLINAHRRANVTSEDWFGLALATKGMGVPGADKIPEGYTDVQKGKYALLLLTNHAEWLRDQVNMFKLDYPEIPTMEGTFGTPGTSGTSDNDVQSDVNKLPE